MQVSGYRVLGCIKDLRKGVRRAYATTHACPSDPDHYFILLRELEFGVRKLDVEILSHRSRHCYLLRDGDGESAV